MSNLNYPLLNGFLSLKRFDISQQIFYLKAILFAFNS